MSQNESKMKNRQAFPLCAAFIDDMRKHFGEVTVRYVKENSVEKGSQGDEGVMASVGVR
jgi:hypothetical protein